MRSMNAVLLDWRPKRTAHVRVATEPHTHEFTNLNRIYNFSLVIVAICINRGRS